MTRSKRIKPVVKLAENNEQDAAATLGASRKKLQEAERKLTELVHYQDEYSRQFNQSGGQVLRGVNINEYRLFLGRLNTAIEQQQLLIEQIRLEAEQKKQNWLGKRVRAQALGKVEDKYKREEVREQDKREQKEMDEYSNRYRNPLK
jgi:flagellar FliJ protein